jgi:glycosyltransferase involved in cell wall biosynthesis
MKILFVHQNFPGQFRHLAPALASLGHEVRALAIDGQGVPGVPLIRYKPTRGTTQGMHPWATDFETKVIRGDSCARAALALKEQGFSPAVIVVHTGWGEGLLLREIFPKARILAYLEFYYAAKGTDVGFDPEHARDDWEDAARVRLRNASNLLSLEVMDWGLAPTAWQRQSFPEYFRDRISVIFDGIDTAAVRPDATAQIRIESSGLVLKPGDEVITFVNRNLEPYRGYHSFLRALPEIQRRRPQAITLIVGGDGVSYGAKAPEGKTWRQIYLEEMGGQLDLSRIHFLGTIPYPAFLRMLQVSACHVYLTYPFVLSWSMLEAMSSGCAVVGSRTPPVLEVLEDGVDGLLVDFFKPDEIAAAVVDVLSRPEAYQAMRQAARAKAVERYDLQGVCLPRQLALIQALGLGSL